MANYNDPVEYILEALKDINGITMSYETVDLIINYFNDFKFNRLMSCYGLRERNIGTIEPQIRYTNTFQGDNVPVIKLKMTFDPDLVKALVSRICHSDEVRKRLNQELTLDDLDYLRKKYDV